MKTTTPKEARQESLAQIIERIESRYNDGKRSDKMIMEMMTVIYALRDRLEAAQDKMSQIKEGYFQSVLLNDAIAVTDLTKDWYDPKANIKRS